MHNYKWTPYSELVEMIDSGKESLDDVLDELDPVRAKAFAAYREGLKKGVLSTATAAIETLRTGRELVVDHITAANEAAIEAALRQSTQWQYSNRDGTAELVVQLPEWEVLAPDEERAVRDALHVSASRWLARLPKPHKVETHWAHTVKFVVKL